MRRDGRYATGLRRIVVAATILAALGGTLATHLAAADERRTDVKTLLTRLYVHGIPYAEAKAVGAQAIPELVSMLEDPAMEEHWTKVVWVLGCIGDPSATGPLVDFLKRQKGEVSADAFRAALAVLPALGHLVRAGDAGALEMLTSYTQPEARREAGLSFSYGRYQGSSLAEVLGRTAIQGLGIAGTPETLAVLESMDRSDLRADWQDNVREAVALNVRVRRMGPARAFAGEDKR
jgi:HEAT repeat protein